ncbi:ABC transporter substrate-binding protein [Streptomyces sp. CMSTAAHL-2]|uniref:ABC transporter substrate-binding protein n=1 Tax=Streptomyces sp. CMSTAAHL-2 TaxID=2904522 RepID=UPI001E4CF190|nr:ABC transporter substrate-binding protein [Streptomyces sp. CMSTAAHL-2]MCE3029066.1 ABC transporter substrate-binding protein [Streptomyces sp. CMSTAAHL-2]
MPSATLQRSHDTRHLTAAAPGTRPTRRGLLAGGLGTAALLGLSACGTGNSASADGGSGGSAWSFTDDRGHAVRLPRRPKRIAFLTDSVGAALWAAGLHPVAATDSGQGIVPAVKPDWSGVTKIYSADKGVRLEALAQARPDLLIDAVQPDGTLQVASQLPEVAKIAPVVGLSTYHSIEQIVGTADQLTGSLGTTLTDGEAKARYQAASTRLRKAIAANQELRVGFVFGIDKNTLGVMNPKTWAVLKTVSALGMNLVPVPGGSANTYSQAVSWENVPSLPADLLVWAVSDPLPDNPLWKRTPAVRAGQLWKPELASWYAYSWENFTVLLDGLATHVHSARAGIGPHSAS